MTWPWPWWVWVVLGVLVTGILVVWYFVFRGARRRR